MSDNTEKPSVDVREIIAFHLSEKASVDAWQRDQELRTANRAVANSFITALADAGIVLRVRSQSKLDKAIEELITVPASRAYNLNDD